jgi:hypothetical protein
LIGGSNIAATAEVPPKSSIILESFMGRILDMPNFICQAKPNFNDVRLGYMENWNPSGRIFDCARQIETVSPPSRRRTGQSRSNQNAQRISKSPIASPQI